MMGFIQMKRHMRLKKTEFTQRIIEQNKDVTKMMSRIVTNHARRSFFEGTDYEHEVFVYDIDSFTDPKEEWDKDEKYIEETYILMAFFKTLAEGIDRGIYDEGLIRINFEHDMRLFYRYSGPFTRTLRMSSDSDDILDMLLPIEFLLKNWEYRRIKKKVKFFG